MVCCHKKVTWVRRKEKDQGRQEGGSAKARFRVSSTKNFFFWFTSIWVWKRPVSIEVSAPTRLSLRGSHVQRKFQKRTTLHSKSSTLKGLLYAGWSSRCEAFVAREAALLPWSKVWVRKLSSDKRQSTFIHELEILWWFPTWAVLRSLADARKCQLDNFCEKKWETLAFCTRNMGAHVRSTSAKKLVSSNFAKILNVVTKIRETCERTLFTPSSPVKATKLYHFCLSDKRSQNRQSILSDKILLKLLSLF